MAISQECQLCISQSPTLSNICIIGYHSESYVKCFHTTVLTPKKQFKFTWVFCPIAIQYSVLYFLRVSHLNGTTCLKKMGFFFN